MISKYRNTCCPFSKVIVKAFTAFILFNKAIPTLKLFKPFFVISSTDLINSLRFPLAITSPSYSNTNSLRKPPFILTSPFIINTTN